MQIASVVRLTRWKEHVPFVMPLTLFGALLASHLSETPLDWRLIPVTVANVLAVTYAFMINDTEDATDDAQDAARAVRNPVASGELTVEQAYRASGAVAVLALFLYFPGGDLIAGIGAVTLLLAHLYSWRLVRLKAYPVVDVISHALMLSGLLILAGYFTYDNSPGVVWLVAAGATLLSVYGQVYNQVRDYELDAAAGLRNTAIVLGHRGASVVMYSSLVLAVVCLLIAVAYGVFPWWLAIVLAFGVLLSRVLNASTDMRGGKTFEASGVVQVRGLFAVNFVAVFWLLQMMVNQRFPAIISLFPFV